jgi:dienelactone hydrolase
MPRAQYSSREQLDLQPMRPYWERYHPERAPFAFKARTLSAAQRWQTRVRRELTRTLGCLDWPQVPLRPKLLERKDKKDYVREKYLLRTSPHTVQPVYLLLPKRRPRPLPVVVAFHGHGYGVKDMVGLWEDGSERDTPDGYHKDFGVALCRMGFAVAAPEIACFGERQNDYGYLGKIMGAPVPTSCHHTATLAFHLGLSVLGLRVLEARRLVDYLSGRKELDLTRLGAMGISGGGMHTFFSTCLDERIRACVVSGYYSSFRESILGMHHCPCNFVPGMWRFGEMHDLAGLLAPRPLLVEAGSKDPIFPIATVQRGVARARKVYAVFGAEAQVRTDYFEGRHQVNGARAYGFLQEVLAKRP